MSTPSWTRRAIARSVEASFGASALAACGAGGTGDAKAPVGNASASGTVQYFTWGNAFSDGIEQKVLDLFHAKQSKIKVEFSGIRSIARSGRRT